VLSTVVPLPHAVPPRSNVTLPVGVATAGATGATVIVKVTLWLNTDGFGCEPIVVVVDALFTVCAMSSALALKFVVWA
jgi:hypothetical protein